MNPTLLLALGLLQDPTPATRPALPPQSERPPEARAPGSVLAGIDFRTADRDANGSLSNEELATAAFARLDADGDGKLSGDELSAMGALGRRRPGRDGAMPPAERPAPESRPAGERRPAPDGRAEGRGLGAQMDANGDGVVDASEFRLPPMFTRVADDDQDGALSADEFARLKERAGRFRGPGADSRPARPGRAGSDADRPEPPASRPAASPRPGAERRGLFGGNPAEFDADADGKLSHEETSAFVFARLDADKSGTVSKDEVGAIPYPPRYSTGQEGTGADRLLQDLDHDRDGAISAKEFRLPELLWRGFDRDGDGFVKEGEMRGPADGAGAGGRGRRAFAGLDFRDAADALAKLDANKDGQVAAAEWKAARPLFDRWDGDKDGNLSKTELETGVERAKQAGLIREPDDFVARFDRNGDGKVTREEFEGPTEAFDRADANGDGSVTAADRPAGTQPPRADEERPRRRRRDGE